MEVKLKNVRLAFGDIFTPSDFQGDGNFKFRATLLIPKNSEAHKQISAAIKQVASDFWKDKAEKTLAAAKAGDNICLRDGDLKDYDGFEGMMALTATNKARPTIVDKDRSPLVAEDGKPYNGCYVNAIVDVFAYSKYGNQVNCSLQGLQFSSDGDAFTAGRPAKADDFDDLSDGADADAGGSASGEDLI
jgi:hypothetical protein